MRKNNDEETVRLHSFLIREPANLKNLETEMK